MGESVRLQIPRTRSVMVWLVAMAVLLFCATWLAHVIKYVLGFPYLYGLLPAFFEFVNVDGEANLAVWYSSTILLGCAMLSGLIARIERKRGGADSRHWLGFALIFLLLSIDETGLLHEKSIWLTVGLAVAIVLATGHVHYVAFLRSLPSRTAVPLVAAGTFYLSGSLLLDIHNGRYVAQHGTESLAFALRVTAEEILEVTGILLAVKTLLDYLRQRVGSLQLRFAEPG